MLIISREIRLKVKNFMNNLAQKVLFGVFVRIDPSFKEFFVLGIFIGKLPKVLKRQSCESIIVPANN